MRYSLKVQLITILFLIAVSIDILFVGEVWAFRQNIKVKIDDTYIEFVHGEPFMQSGHIFVSARDLLDTLNLRYGYTEDDGELTIKINGNTYVLRPNENIIRKNSSEISVDIGLTIVGEEPYVPLKDLCEILYYNVTWNSQTMTAKVTMDKKPNPMDGTFVGDEYRYDIHIGEYNGYDIFEKENIKDRFCMELVTMDEDKRSRYAEIVNRFAEAVPEAKTYNIVVPTASEFYAPIDFKSDYLSEITDIYDKLSDNVTPINAVRPLSENTDKNIYFKTDHHWTHLGAYYVYKEFLNYTGAGIASPESFKTEEFTEFQGSFPDYMKDTEGFELMRDTYDELILYYPETKYTGEAYFDVDLSEYISDMMGINTNFKNYDCLLEGDYPIEVFKTNSDSGKKLCVVKESFGNAFAVWALNNYSEVYVIDYRCFNGYYNAKENSREFSISRFYENVKFDDLVLISYPVTVMSEPELGALGLMAR